MRRGNSRTCRFDKLLKLAVSQIAEYDARRLQRIGGQLRRNLRVNAAGRYKQIGMAVIIEIDDAGAPTHETRLHAQAACDRHVLEKILPLIAVEDAGVIGEMRLENIEIAIQVEVARAHSHAGLFVA